MKKTDFYKAQEVVEHYDVLGKYEWIDGYLKIPDVQKRIGMLNRESRRVQGLPITKKEFGIKLKADFEKIKEKRIDWLKKYLHEIMEHENPLQFYNQRATHPHMGGGFAPHVSWEEINKAFVSIKEGEGAISAKKKESELLKLDEELAELRTDLASLSRPDHFINQGSRIIGDKRKDFIQAWQQLQAQMSEECDPFGRSLHLANKVEKEAYEKLFLSQDVNPNGKYVPDQRPGQKQ